MSFFLCRGLCLRDADHYRRGVINKKLLLYHLGSRSWSGCSLAGHISQEPIPLWEVFGLARKWHFSNTHAHWPQLLPAAVWRLATQTTQGGRSRQTHLTAPCFDSAPTGSVVVAQPTTFASLPSRLLHHLRFRFRFLVAFPLRLRSLRPRHP